MREKEHTNTVLVMLQFTMFMLNVLFIRKLYCTYSTRSDLTKKGICHPCVMYGDVINKAQKFKSNISKRVKSLKNRIVKAII